MPYLCWARPSFFRGAVIAQFVFEAVVERDEGEAAGHVHDDAAELGVAILRRTVFQEHVEAIDAQFLLGQRTLHPHRLIRLRIYPGRPREGTLDRLSRLEMNADSRRPFSSSTPSKE